MEDIEIISACADSDSEIDPLPEITCSGGVSLPFRKASA